MIIILGDVLFYKFRPFYKKNTSKCVLLLSLSPQHRVATITTIKIVGLLYELIPYHKYFIELYNLKIFLYIN